MHLHYRLIAIPVLALALTGTAVAQAVGEAPQIVSAAINPDPVHPGGRVEAIVRTSPDVTAVDARVKGFKFSLNEVQPGQFQQTGTVPKIARFFKGTYHVVFTAHCAGGQTTQFGEDVVLN